MSKRIKTQSVVEVVEVTRWLCRDPKHQHRSEDVAQRCIDKDIKPKRVQVEWTDAKYLAALERFESSGLTLAAFGRSLGYSGTYASHIIKRARRIRDRAAKS